MHAEDQDMFITAQEMERLTGCKIKSKQCEVLRNNHIRFVIDRDGSPVLPREALYRQLASKGEIAIASDEPEINFEAL